MQYETITPLLNRFNDLVDSLINDFKEYNLDEDTLVMISKKTRNFITFTELALINVNFTILETINDIKYNFNDEINQSKEMVENIFKQMNESLDKILEHEDEEEEHNHGHDHGHEHHHHVDIDDVQDDINIITECLIFLKKLLGEIGNMVISVVRYQTDEISEEQFNTLYNEFKENISKYKDEFEQKLQK